MTGQRPFSGIKVLALTSVYAAPFAAYQLALHGAEVINIEEPSGDMARTLGAGHAKALIQAKMGAAFLAHGAGKKSLTLNLRMEEAKAIFRTLAAEADVIIENMRSGSMDGYGLGYAEMSKLNPKLIYCSLTGYGQTGPKRRDAAIDPVIQAASGLMSITGTPQTGPLKAGATVADYASGFALALGIVTALFHRERTGSGQYVDVSMLETAMVMMSSTVSDVMNAGLVPQLLGNRSQNSSPVMDTFMCADACIFIAATNESRRQKLWSAMERMDIPADSRFDGLESIRRHEDELYAEMGRTLQTRTAEDWESILNKAGVPCMKVRTIAESVEQPQIKERRLYKTIENVPGLDAPVKVPLSPYRLSAAPPDVDLPPPRLGAHTEEILGGLGYSPAEIAGLRATGAI